MKTDPRQPLQRRRGHALGRTLADLAGGAPAPRPAIPAALVVDLALVAALQSELDAARAELAQLRRDAIRRDDIAAITIRESDGTSPGSLPPHIMRALCERIAARRRA